MVKCSVCNKKTHITFKCRCELEDLCIKCKSPEEHDCQYDYKAEQKNKIIKDNPQIIAQKIVNQL